MEQVGMQVGGSWEFNLGLMQLCLCYADGYGPQDIGCSFTFIIALISQIAIANYHLKKLFSSSGGQNSKMKFCELWVEYFLDCS